MAEDAPVSEAQRKAMGAAMSGHSNIGIPKSVGKEFIEKDPGGALPAKSKDETSPKPASGPMSTKADTEKSEGLPRTVEPFKVGDSVGKGMSLDEIKSQAKRIGRY